MRINLFGIRLNLSGTRILNPIKSASDRCNGLRDSVRTYGLKDMTSPSAFLICIYVNMQKDTEKALLLLCPAKLRGTPVKTNLRRSVSTMLFGETKTSLLSFLKNKRTGKK